MVHRPNNRVAFIVLFSVMSMKMSSYVSPELKLIAVNVSM